jgi:23S rRNA (guanosine2251-2'-O)-methyltransferase
MTEIVFGIHAVRAAVRAKRATRVFISGDNRRAQEIADAADALGIAVVKSAKKTEIEKIAGEQARHQGVAAYCAPLANRSWRAIIAGKKAPLLVALDGVTDPRNLGAAMRSAAFFGADCVIVPRRRSAPLSAAAAKAASGAALAMCRIPNLARALEEMKEAGLRVIGATAAGAKSVYQTDLALSGGGVAWVFGGEGGGLRRLTAATCDELATIPSAATTADSLNVAAACAVCLAETQRQRAAGR